MSAVLRQAVAAIRRGRVQTVVITLVVLLSSLASTLALTLLKESDAPFDHAFERQSGAHLMVTFDSASVTAEQLRGTGTLPPISAAAGPWTTVGVPIVGPLGGEMLMPITERASPAGTVDRLSIARGRWLLNSHEIVVSQRSADEGRLLPGDTVTPGSGAGLAPFRVVGIATALNDDSAAWVLPGQLPPSVGGPIHSTYLMAYRINDASSARAIVAAADAISASLPPAAVIGTSSYLDVKLNADRTTAVMIPFLLAFSGFALLASVLIIANLVGGAVIAGYRELGILKSVGFTPGQVVAVVAGQMLIPAALGCALGVAGGILSSQPFLADTAHAFGLPPSSGIAPIVDGGALIIILAVVMATATAASLRVARLSAASAIAVGSAPAPGQGFRLPRLAARLPLPISLTLGLRGMVARPIRSLMTLLAIVIGVATVTFALGLNRSLVLVAASLTRSQQVQVEVFRGGGKGNAGPSDAEVMSAISSQPGTARLVAEVQTVATVSGAGEPVPIYAYRRDSSWLGYVLIQGRWFGAAGEAVAPTAFFTRTGHHVGDAIVATQDGRAVTLKLVGEIFDQQGDNILLRTSLRSLETPLQPELYEVQLKPSTDPAAYAAALQSVAGVDAAVRADRGIDTAFLLINGVLGGLALVLTLIAVSGVFNTVVLNTRENARETAILKSIGMTPPQVITMVLVSVIALGALAALIGIPAGEALHRYMLVVMGQVATATAIPDPFFRVFPVGLVGAIALGGIGIAVLGAALPARWAAYSAVTQVLQTE